VSRCLSNRQVKGRIAKEILPQEIDEKLAELAGKEGLKPATLNRYRALLSLVYFLANRNGKVVANPARVVRLRKENNASFYSWRLRKRKNYDVCFEKATPVWKPSLIWLEDRNEARRRIPPSRGRRKFSIGHHYHPT